MNHKLTLWPSIAAVIIWLTPLFLSHCGEKPVAPEPILRFRLIEPGIPGVPNLPPIPPVLPDNKNLSFS
jgi:hypothetical protein